MARIPDSQLVEFPGFPKGIDNIRTEDSVRAGAAREIVNVDLDETGKPSRRRGYDRVLFAAGGGVHSLYADAERQVVVYEGDLVKLSDEFERDVLLAGVGELPISYAAVAGRLFWTNGAVIGVLMQDDAAVDVWPATPGQPSVAPYLGIGGLAAGEYQVAITSRDSYGRESGSTLAAFIQLEDGDGIRLDNIAPTPGAVSHCVYVTTPGGDVPYAMAEIPVGTTSWIVGNTTRGRALATQWLAPMPAGQAIAYAAGRLWVAVGAVLYFSEPLRYGAMLPDNYIRFSHHIDMLGPTGDAADSGLYVGAGKRTIYLNGPDPKAMQHVIARPAGAVPGSYLPVHTSVFSESLDKLPQVNAAAWLAADGVFCLGLPGGQIFPVTHQKTAMTQDAERAAIMLRTDGGLNQIVTAVRGGEEGRASASDQLTGTLYRGGIEVE